MKLINKSTLALIILSIVALSSAFNLKVKHNRSCKDNPNFPECQWLHLIGPGGKCISAKNFKGELVQENCSNEDHVLWNIIYVNPDEVVIQNKSGKVIDNANFKNENGNKLCNWDNHSGKNQKWRIEFVGHGNKVHFKNPDTRKCIDNTGNIRNGQYYHIWDCDNNNKNQMFELQLPAGHKWFNIVDKYGTCMSAKHNGNLTKEKCGNDNGTLWAFIPYKIGYLMLSKTGRVMDNYDNKTNNGNKTISYKRHNQDNQMWRIEATKNGKIRIKNVQCNKCIDDTSQKTNNFYHIWDCDKNNKNQFFTIQNPPQVGNNNSSSSSSSSNSNSKKHHHPNPKYNMERNTNTK